MVVDYELISMISGVTASFIMTTVMWSAARHYGVRAWRYVLLLQMLSVTGLIGATVLLAEIIMRIAGVDTTFMRYFIKPVEGICEIGLVIYAVFYVVRGSMHLLEKLVYIVFAFFIVVALYPCVYRLYLDEGSSFWDIDSYILFTSTWQSIGLTSVIFIIGILFMIMATREVIRGYNRYRDLLEMYFSEDLTSIRRQCMKWLSCCILFSVSSFVNVVSMTSGTVYITSRYAMIVFYVAVCILVLENHGKMERVEMAFQNIKRKNISVLSAEFILSRVYPEPSLSRACRREGKGSEESDAPDLTRIKVLMERWVARDDKPYMRTGITLQDFADDIHVPMPLLVKYGYQVYGTNFREWILSLRQGN